MTVEDMVKELVSEQKEHGKLIATLVSQMESMHATQKQHAELVLLKINSRLDAFDARCIKNKENLILDNMKPESV